MKKIKYFVSKFLKTKIALAVLIVCLAMAPTIYAQFARQTGTPTTGWGYGYGYGYGYGSGFDHGTTAGYRMTGVASSTYAYGYGYGYIPAGGYDSTDGYAVTPGTIGDLIQAGVMIPNNGNASSTTAITFKEKVTLTSGGATIVIPAGTVMTSTGSFDMSTLTAGTATLTGSPIDSVGSLQFGLPGLGLELSSPGVTISIPVTGLTDGVSIDVYSKTPGGSWIQLGGGCVVGAVTTGMCTFTTTHLSDFVVGSTCDTTSVAHGSVSAYPSCTITCNTGYSVSGSSCVANSGSSGGGGSYTPACTSVTYGDYAAACFAGYQYRNVTARTPSICSLTAAQQDASRKVCGAVPDVNITGQGLINYQDANNTANFIALEKNLVKKINKALAKRLSGRILLQVEEKGEAWYVHPIDGLKYYLGRPADAFAVMRNMALGINNKNFDSYKGKAPARLAGRILLKVEDHGEAWYINPVDLKMHYMGRPADAFALMRKFGLGITNANLRQIGVGEIK